MIDPEIIRSFRNKVNSDSYFTLHKYKDRNGKNHWSLICACMDWIDLCVDYLLNNKLENQNINVMSMQVYTYISSIDIIWQSIQQLYRAIIDVNSIPFDGEKQIFHDNNICKDDNDYFKHIRAVFGAHPVNLNDKNGKWFASWPAIGIYTEFDFSVLLYSAEVENDDIVFGFRFAELNKFLQARYSYLETLNKELDIQYKKYIQEISSITINQSENIQEQLKILKQALEERLNNDYFSYLIDDLIVIFDAENSLPENQEVVNEYRTKLKDLVNEIAHRLQHMNFDNLKSDWILASNHPPQMHYPLSKLYECLRGTRSSYDMLYSYFIKEVSGFLKNYVSISEQMDREEVFMLTKAGLYKYWLDNSK